MNAGLILDLFLLVVALAAVVWAMAERARAAGARAELARAGEDRTLAAGAVADALVRRASEAFEAQNKLSQARIEAQLKPVADTLEKFEKKVADADAARAREAGGVKVQLDQLMAATAAT